MITILGAIVGLLPNLLKYFQDASDKKQELAIMQLQFQIMQQGLKDKLQATETVAQARTVIALNQSAKTNIRWIDAFNGLIRPLIAIIFTIKIVAAMVYPDEVKLVDHDYGIYSCILAFYFGGLVRSA